MNRQPQLLIDITSAALNKPGAALWMRQAAELAQKFNSVIGIQVHNSAAPEDLALAKNSGFPLSFHAPVAGEYMMNLAAEDASTSWQMIDDQARLMELYQVKTAGGSEVLIPAVAQFVKSVSIEERLVIVTLIPGFIEDAIEC